MEQQIKHWEELCAQGIRQGPFFRSLGAIDSGEHIGCGFMNKPSGVDQERFSAPYYALSYVVSGQGQYQNDDDGQIYELKPGSVFSRLPEIKHTTTIYPGEEWIEFYISCGPKMSHSLIACGTLQDDPLCSFLGSSKIWLDTFVELSVMSQNLSENQIQAFMLRCISLLENIFTTIRSINSGEDEKMIQSACFELSRCFGEQLSIQTLCREHGWNHDYFRKQFKKHIGLSPAQFRICRRIDAAKELLITHTNMKLADCAQRLGYCSVYDFSAQFKKVTGTSPGHFRLGK